MSKAFTSDDVVTPEALPPLPLGRRPITAGGMVRLRRAHADLLAQAVGSFGAARDPNSASFRGSKAAQRHLLLLERQMMLSDVAPSPGAAPKRVVLGTRVQVREDEEEGGVSHVYVLVGPDEVDVAQRRVSHASPVGRALLGRTVGERTFIKRPAGVLEVVIEAIAADPDCEAQTAG